MVVHRAIMPDPSDPDDGVPGSAQLSQLVLRIAEDALARGLVGMDPVIPIDYRRILCLSDGSRVEIRMTRLPICPCGRVHNPEGAMACAVKATRAP